MNSVNHVLYELFLRSSESSEVGDVVCTVIRLTVLSVDTSDLYVIFVSDSLELILLLGELWKLDMDRGS